MHHSKSSSLLPPGVTTKHIELTNSQRARRRSSLDTFVIPGRTRVPSSKNSKSSETDVTDFLITQGLLRHSMMQLPNKQPSSIQELQYQGRGSWSGTSSPRSGKKSSNRIQKRPSRVRAELVMQPPPRYGSRHFLHVPPQRPRIDAPQPAAQIVLPPTSAEHDQVQTYDGANEAPDSGHAASRMMSMTWSTVSHRIFTDSSGSSRRSGASYYLIEYNQLAEKHGLRPMPEASSDDGSETKTTTKTHHGWLARKIFRRTSSSYTLKAKTTYKPLTRKKSLGRIPMLSSNAPKNIITGKSLEELGRLGGLGILLLPHEFAVDKLTLPTSLSAIATYLLQHGCNAPGLFRVSGQITTINALYDFYDQQFSDAGSPSKVEATVGSGLLPTHIEHTLPDVASLFKKILIGLPGGLLGSLKLFEALDDILLKLQPDSELAESDHAALKAKLVALAISSVTSAYRVYLIEAVVGLVAYFAAETEKFQAEQAAAVAEDQERPGSSKSELMGHQSLGVVLGPLLLGDLTDKIDVNGGDESLEGAPRKSSESAKRSKKQKRNSVPNKLEKDANLSAHVDRANLTATVMQQLLIVWRDVVNQLREMNGKYSSSLMQSRSTSQIKTIPTRTTSRLTLRSSEEEMQLMDFLRGRSLPGEFRGPVEVKRKVRISGRSPMSRGAFKVSEDGQIHGEGVLGACQQQANGDTDDNNVDKPAVQDSAQTFDFYASASTRRDEHDAEDSAGLSADGITHSDIAMDKMAMGTILPRLRDPSDSSVSPGRVRLVPSMSDHSEDDNSEPEDSSNEAPQTVVKIARTPNYNDEPNTTRQRPSLDTSKPLPPIGNAQRAELSSPLSGDELTQVEARGLLSSRRSSRRSMSALSARHSSPRTLFPARQGRRGSREIYSPPRQSSYPLRQDSLPTEGHLQMKSIEMDENFADYRARSNAQMSPMKNFSRKLSEAPFGSDQIFGDPKRNSVKAIAQQFAEQSRAQRNEVEATKTRELPKVYAYVHPLLTPNDQVVDLPLEDPFVSLDDAAVQERPQIQRSLSPEKESLIPRPLFDIGRGRKAESRSPSPNKMDSPSTPKRAPAKSPAKRLSIYNSVQDQNAEIIRRDTNEISKSAAKTKREAIMESMHAINTNSLSLSEGTPGPSLEVVPLRPSARRSAEPFYFRSSHRDEPPTTTTLTNRAISLARSESPTGRSVSPNRNAKRSLSHLDTITRSNSFLNASDELKKLERHGSINTALYTEICRLQRTLEQKGEEVLAVRRGVEVQRVVGKDGEGKRESWGKDGVKRESWGRDKVDDEVEKARKEIDVWRVRAERAERRLAEKDQIQRTTSGFLGSGGESKGSRDWGTSPGLPDREPDIEVIKTRDPGTDAGSLAGPRLEVSGADSRNQEMDAGSQGQTNLGVSS